MNQKELELLHNKILEIAEYFDAFCKENNIIYYLMGGTALGAVRHSGFIPWDDDFDVFMDRENYLKFLSVSKTSLDTKRYYFQEENTHEFPLYFSKIRMNNTTFIEKDVMGREMHHGIYIDIMCLNNASSITIIRYLQYIAARILNAKSLSDRGYITDSIIKKIYIYMSKYLVSGFTKSILLHIVRMFKERDTQMVGHFFGRAPFQRTSFFKKYLGSQRYVKFEHLSLPVPEFAEEYLVVRYGDNYLIPPTNKEKMEYPSHAYIVDTRKSYKHYLNDVE